MHTATNDTVSILFRPARIFRRSPGNANLRIGVPGLNPLALSRAGFRRTLGASTEVCFQLEEAAKKTIYELPSRLMTAPREIRTARLLLRSFRHEDVPTIVRLAGAREIASTTIQIPHPYAEDDARNFVTAAEEDFRSGLSVSFAIATQARGELCGAMGLHLAAAHKRAELGYWIGVPFWGRGYATEAARAVVAFGFDSLRLHRIYAHHFAGNTASQRVLEKIGMSHEGRSRQHIQKWDQFIDIENYGLLAEEFRRGEPPRRSDAAREGE